MIHVTTSTAADITLTRSAKSSSGQTYLVLDGKIAGCVVNIIGKSMMGLEYAVKACDAWSKKTEGREVYFCDQTGEAFKRESMSRCLATPLTICDEA